ncbi:MAG: NUDIX hydrolase, partial [Sphingomonadales bacterium]
MSRAYPDKPLVGVGVVIRRGGEILLVRRGKPPARHSWSIPGGVQRLGETVADTARREVLEETGLTVDLTEFLGVVDFIDRDDLGNVRYHYTLL